MKVYNPILKQEEEKETEVLKLTLYVGMLEFFKERAKELVKLENAVLYTAYRKNIKRARNKSSFKNTPKTTLIKWAGKNVFKVSKQLDLLILDVLDFTERFVNKDRIVTDIDTLISRVKSRDLKVRDLKVSKYPLLPYEAIKFIEEEKVKPKKVKNEKKTLLEDLPLSYVGQVYKIDKVLERDEDRYYGRLFPLPDEAINALKEYKHKYLKND